MAEKRKPKLSVAGARQYIVRWLQNNISEIKIKPDFQIKVLVQDKRNSRIPILVNKENKTVHLVSEMHLDNIIRNAGETLHEKSFSFFNKGYSDFSNLYMSGGQIEDIKKTWFASTKSEINLDVKPFVFMSDPNYGFARASFDIGTELTITPTWDRLLENFSNKNAIMMFFGSLAFDESFKRHQYLWIHGRGGDGKGAMIRAIKEIFGHSFRSVFAPEKNDIKHWTYQLIGSRLVVFPECENYAFPKSALFKTLTGGDTIPVEQKFHDAFNVELMTKYIFLSNQLPRISSHRADQRRIILSTTLQDKEHAFDPNFETALKAELGAFFTNCVLMYKASCPLHEPIPSDQTNAILLGEQYDEEFEAFLTANFNEGAGLRCSNSDMFDALKRNGLMNSKRNFYAFLDKKGIKRDVPMRVGSLIMKGFEGISSKYATITPDSKCNVT